MQCLNPFVVGYGVSATPSGDYLAIGSAADWVLACPSLGGNLTLSNPGDASNVISITPAGVVTLGSLALTTPLAVAYGGTGSATQNFIDLSTNQTGIAGSKTFAGTVRFNSAFTLAAHLNQANANNNAGTITLVAGTKAFTFANAYNSTPVVILTPIGAPAAGAELYLSALSTSGFTVTSTSSSDTRVINWVAFGNPN